nr:MAG TPA: hypothetical protein [Caudoviricetes sp.]
MLIVYFGLKILRLTITIYHPNYYFCFRSNIYTY